MTIVKAVRIAIHTAYLLEEKTMHSGENGSPNRIGSLGTWTIWRSISHLDFSHSSTLLRVDQNRDHTLAC